MADGSSRSNKWASWTTMHLKCFLMIALHQETPLDCCKEVLSISRSLSEHINLTKIYLMSKHEMSPTRGQQYIVLTPFHLVISQFISLSGFFSTKFRMGVKLATGNTMIIVKYLLYNNCILEILTLFHFNGSPMSLVIKNVTYSPTG